MPSRRQQQVADLLLREVSVLVQRELKDPRIGFVTLTKVDISPDLRHARVFFSVLGTEEEQKDSQRALERSSSFIRRELAARLGMRYIPDISFRSDASIAHSDRIARLLHQIDQQEAEQEESEAVPLPEEAPVEEEDREQ